MSISKTLLPVPQGTNALKIVCGVANIIIPGLGLLVLRLSSKSPDNENNTFIICGCQFALAFVGVGWIWGIFNGIKMIHYGLNDKQ
jgi:hypothetical protein